MFSPMDAKWMQEAIKQAKRAAENQEVPVGAVLVLNDQIIGAGSNCPIGQIDPCGHAEIIALRQGATTLNNYRLPLTTLYVTLEPCLMCLGALVHARVKRVVYGALDYKSGAVESVFSLGSANKFNHQIDFLGGLLAEECAELLSSFFKARRLEKSSK